MQIDHYRSLFKIFLNCLTIFLNTKQEFLLKISPFSFCKSIAIIFHHQLSNIYIVSLQPQIQNTLNFPYRLVCARDCGSPNTQEIGVFFWKSPQEWFWSKGTFPTFLYTVTGINNTSIAFSLARKPQYLFLWMCQHFHWYLPVTIDIYR